MKINKVIVKTPTKKKHRILHDQEITPPRTAEQILAALKQQFEVFSFVIDNGVATVLVGKKETKEETADATA
jgi:hypothetical protein